MAAGDGANGGGGGGAVYVRGGELEVVESIFVHCRATSGNGGALLVADTLFPKKPNKGISHFQHKGGAEHGGRSNYGNVGEDAWADGGSDDGSDGTGSWTQLNVTNSFFTNCWAAGAGGGLALFNHKNVTGGRVVLEGSHFRNNVADAGPTANGRAYGGALKLQYSSHVFNSPHHYHRCTFVNNSLYAGKGAFGGGFYLNYNAPVTSSPVRMEGCDILDNSLHGVADAHQNGARGGGAYVRYGCPGGFGCAPTKTSPLLVRQCRFEGNTVIAHGSNADGGGLHVRYGSLVENSALDIDACRFAGNKLCQDGSGWAVDPRQDFMEGAGLDIRYDFLLTNSPTRIAHSQFLQNSINNSHGGDSYGGGMALTFGWGYLYGARVAGGTTENPFKSFQAILTNNTFRENQLWARAGAAQGGGLVVKGQRLLDSKVNINKCHFESNSVQSAFAQGGGVYIKFERLLTESTSVVVSALTSWFLSNSAAVLQGGAGGGLHFEIDQGVTLKLADDSHFAKNSAGGNGGAMSVVQTVKNPPSNLVMEVDEEDSPDGRIFRNCYAECNASDGSAVFRLYNHSSPAVRLIGVTLDRNRAGRPTQGTDRASERINSGSANNIGSGGAVHLVNLRMHASSCNITANSARFSGGALFLDGGSGSLLIDGDSKVSDNRVDAGGAGGGTLFSGSKGGVVVAGNTVLGIGSVTPLSDIVITAGGEANFTQGGAVMKCRPGQKMLNDVAFFSQENGDWKIDCREVVNQDIVDPLKNRTGGDKHLIFANPTCDKLRIGDNTTSIHSCNCDWKRGASSCVFVPLQPVMAQSSGSISCTPCPFDQYSIETATWGSGMPNPETITCHVCPFGASCAGGGASIRVKPGFWAYGETKLAMLRCPFGYCCGESSGRGGGSGGGYSCPWRGIPMNTEGLRAAGAGKSTAGVRASSGSTTSSACQGYRDPTIPLCGGCLPGYSLAIDDPSCVPTSSCADTYKAASWVLLTLLYYIAYVFYALYQARFSPLIRRLPRYATPGEANSGGSQCLVFFFQVSTRIQAASV
jgi:hypothetical protein